MVKYKNNSMYSGSAIDYWSRDNYSTSLEWGFRGFDTTGKDFIKTAGGGSNSYGYVFGFAL